MKESENIISLQEIITAFNLKPHVEGGYSQLLYEDLQMLKKESLPKGFKGSRSLWNAIYYLLPRNSKCSFHRIKMTELWNFYLGGPLELFDISVSGELKKIVLGKNISAGEQLAYVFPKDHWIGAKLISDFEFSLVSCVTCPGFTFSDWEKGDRQELLKKYPHFHEIITMLTD